MFLYEKNSRKSSVPSTGSRKLVRADTLPAAVLNQQSAYSNFQRLQASYSDPNVALTDLSNQDNDRINDAEREEEANKASMAIIEAELDAYNKASCFEIASTDDLLRFWQACFCSNSVFIV